MASRLRSDAGMSLAELLVTMMILGIVTAMITGTFISLQRTVAGSSQRFDDLGQARLALDASTKSLRTAIRLRPDESPFTVASANEVEFYANLSVAVSEAPQRVRLQVVGGELIETMTRGQIVQVPDPDNPGQYMNDWQANGAPRQRVVARDLVGGEPLFTYFEQGSETPLATDEAGALSDGDRDKVRYVRVRAAIQSTDAFNVSPTVVSNRVHMPNLFFVREEEASS